MYSGTLPNLTKSRVVAGTALGPLPLPTPMRFPVRPLLRNGMQSGARVELRSQSDLNQPSQRRPGSCFLAKDVLMAPDDVPHR